MANSVGKQTGGADIMTLTRHKGSEFGPNGEAVADFIERVIGLRAEDIVALGVAAGGPADQRQTAHPSPGTPMSRADQAKGAKAAGRSEAQKALNEALWSIAWGVARTAAKSAPAAEWTASWQRVWPAIYEAAHALLLKDIIPSEQFAILTRPCRDIGLIKE